MNQKNNRKKKYLILIAIFGFVLLILFLFICFSLYFLSPVGGNKSVEFVVNQGDSTSEIADSLKKKGLIKNAKVFMAYAFITNHRAIYAAKYDLNSGMRLSEIVDTFDEGGRNINEITLTFKEGVNIRDMAKLISKETDNSYDDVIKLANDKAYLNELIKKYWFIDKDVFNRDIYYSLEGYLYPDSYNFSSKEVSVREIFDDMLENTDMKLKPYKKYFSKSKYSVHQILTLASVLELEVSGSNSRRDVAGIFYNRLNSDMPLGSDATSYYGVRKDLNGELLQSEFDSVNPYNTRVSSMAGKLPAGPICNPSISSIVAALKPSKHDYYYFVTDKNGKVYLTKNFDMHNKVIKNLKDKGLWFEW